MRGWIFSFLLLAYSQALRSAPGVGLAKSGNTWFHFRHRCSQVIPCHAFPLLIESSAMPSNAHLIAISLVLNSFNSAGLASFSLNM